MIISLLLFSSFFTCTLKAQELEQLLASYRVEDKNSEPLPLPQEDILVDKAGFQTDEVSAYVVDLGQNSEVYNLNEDKFFIPASVSKILTAIASVRHYGLDHRFETKIFTNAPKLDSILEGDLILQGAGDPSLDFSELESLALALPSLGIKEIKGKIFFDDSVTPSASNISSYFGLLDVYNPAISSFNFNRSRIPVKLKRNGTQYVLSSQEFLNPKFQVQLSSKLKTTDPLYAYNQNAQNSVWTLNLNHALANYTFNANQEMVLEEIPMLNPAHYFSQMFFKKAKMYLPTLEWTQLQGQAFVSDKDQLLTSVKGKDLRYMMEKVLTNSDNAYTEMLSARLAYDLDIKLASLDDSARFMLDWWAKNYPKIDLRSVIFSRSSGLTPKNYFTSRQLVEVLEFFHKTPLSTASNEYLESFLPISGVRGELAEDLDMPITKGKVFAKSGYLSYVRALSGYLVTQKGNKLAFSIMINDFHQREILNNPSHPDYTKAVTAADAWASKSKNLRDALLLKWASEN